MIFYSVSCYNILFRSTFCKHTLVEHPGLPDSWLDLADITGSILGGLTATLALHKWHCKMRLLKHLCIYEFMSYIMKITLRIG